MTERHVGEEFSVAAGKRDLQIFLLKDTERLEFRRMEAVHGKEQEDLRKLQEERRLTDIERAKGDIRSEHLKPALKPNWRLRKEALKSSELQLLAEHRVDVWNQRESRDLAHVQRQREDDYLARRYEERMLRNAREGNAKDRHEPSRAHRDFDKARDRER